MNQWLTGLEKECENVSIKDVALWPGSVVRQMQPTVIQMQGVGDLDKDNPNSRTHQIIQKISDLIRSGDLRDDFSVVDVCCGDGLILSHIKRAYPHSECAGIEINKGGVDGHTEIMKSGVHLYRIPIQRLFVERPPRLFDLSMMLNTYRNWPASQRRTSEQNLPELADDWFSSSSRMSILTAESRKVDSLSEGYSVTDIGAGEQGTRMILVRWEKP